VHELLAAGIEVLTTVNVQHLESLNDVVQTITGVPQRETVPDAVVRAAEQVELVDIAPEALRRRMAHGNVYPADRVDAALGSAWTCPRWWPIPDCWSASWSTSAPTRCGTRRRAGRRGSARARTRTGGGTGDRLRSQGARGRLGPDLRAVPPPRSGRGAAVSRVLLVEDDPQLARAMRITLAAGGHEVVAAATGRKALSEAAEARPDLVVLALGPPDLDGVEVIEGLRGWTGVPIICCPAVPPAGTRWPRSTPAPTTT
jgi:two-component system sensor histidine kinase KdpD